MIKRFLIAAAISIVAFAAQAASVTANVKSSAPTYSNNATSPLTLDTDGQLWAKARIFGTQTDAKSTATDTTSITFMQVFKQISASVQAVATSTGLGSTAAAQVLMQTALDAISDSINEINGNTPPKTAGNTSPVSYCDPVSGACFSTAAPGTTTPPIKINAAWSASSATCVTEHADRYGLELWNKGTTTVYLNLNTTAATTAFGGYGVPIDPGGYWRPVLTVNGVYPGRITCIWAAGGSGALVGLEYVQ